MCVCVCACVSVSVSVFVFVQKLGWQVLQQKDSGGRELLEERLSWSSRKLDYGFQLCVLYVYVSICVCVCVSSEDSRSIFSPFVNSPKLMLNCLKWTQRKTVGTLTLSCCHRLHNAHTHYTRTSV